MNITLALILDTFREAMARKIFWGLFAISTLMILFFLFVMKIDIVEGAMATITLFGNTGRRQQNIEEIVRGVHGAVAAFLYTWGMFLAVFASSGLVPSILEPGRIELLLSKPVSRRHILLGRFAGNVLVVAMNTSYLVLGVWIIFGAKTGIWNPAFLFSIVSTVFMFAVLLSIVLLAGVLWESAAVSTMATVAIALMSPILAQNKLAERLLSSQWTRDLWNALYYALPKVYDAGRMTFEIVQNRPADSWMPFWSSAAFCGAILLAGVTIFEKRDF